jgi:hypothetical protein
MTSIVYAVQRPCFFSRSEQKWVDKFDLSPAEHYGKLVYCLPPGNVPHDLATSIDTLSQALKDYKAQDYLLAVGDPVAIVAAGLIAGKQTGGSVTVLKWDHYNREYTPYDILI